MVRQLHSLTYNHHLISHDVCRRSLWWVTETRRRGSSLHQQSSTYRTYIYIYVFVKILAPSVFTRLFALPPIENRKFDRSFHRRNSFRRTITSVAIKIEPKRCRIFRKSTADDDDDDDDSKTDEIFQPPVLNCFQFCSPYCSSNGPPPSSYDPVYIQRHLSHGTRARIGFNFLP